MALLFSALFALILSTRFLKKATESRTILLLAQGAIE